MTELYTEHMSIGEVVHENGNRIPTGLIHDRFKDLEARGFRPEYEEWRIVPSESEGHAYAVAKITVLAVPHKKADIVADQVTKHICSCSDFYYHRSAGIETDAEVESIGRCKHCTVFRHTRAEQDESQETP